MGDTILENLTRQHITNFNGDPASVKIEKNSKGYNIEVGLHAGSLETAMVETVRTLRWLEAELAKKPGDNGCLLPNTEGCEYRNTRGGTACL